MTDFWDRYTKLRIKNPTAGNEKIVSSDELTVHFRTYRYFAANIAVSYGATEDNTIIAEILIYNLSQETINSIEYEDSYTKTGGSTVVLESGYRENHGVVFTGLVASMTHHRVGGDVATVLICRESRAIVQNVRVNIQYSYGKTISELVEALANLANVPIGRIDNIQIAAGNRTFAPTQSLDSIFTDLAMECGDRYRYEFVDGALYFLDMDIDVRTMYNLVPETGLLSMYLEYDPAYINDSYNVTSLLLHDIKWMDPVKLGDYICSVVTKPVHTSNEKDHYTQFLATVGAIPRRSSGFGGEW